MDDLALFVIESNTIEGITRTPTMAELTEFERFYKLDVVDIDDLVRFVGVYQPDARLRDHKTVPGVRVGSHIAPRSGSHIRASLEDILAQANAGANAFDVHQQYEHLHPFTDGNGRSGRALWAWMYRDLHLGFLHRWYYQSLENWRPKQKQ